jgi:membrane AbrB-like protein
MNTLVPYGIIFCLAVMSFALFKKLHFPAPAVLGPALFIGVLQILGWGLPELPQMSINFFQIIIGLSIGSRINHNKIEDILKSWKPSLAVFIYTLLSTLVMTLIFCNFTSGFFTALFSVAPGGMSEMVMISLSYDAQVAVITTFQFVRLMAVISIVPFIVRALKNRQDTDRTTESVMLPPETSYSLRIYLTFAAGVAAGAILILCGIPGGGIIGAMTAVGILNVIYKQEYRFPVRVMTVAFLGVGTAIGLDFSPPVFRMIQEMFLPIVIFSVTIVLGNLLLGWFIHRYSHWDIVTSFLGSSPGGLSQMVLIGEEMKADIVRITILQLVRILTILICIPLFAALVNNYF